MSYKLTKPYSEEDKAKFIVEYNHNQGLRIEETPQNLFALQDWEILINDLPTKDPNYEHELEKKEKERISMLHLTKREVFLGLKRAKNVMPEEIRAQITDNEAQIEFDFASQYYRGNPLVDIIGRQLGISSKQLDNFFETNDYTKLIEEEK